MGFLMGESSAIFLTDNHFKPAPLNVTNYNFLEYQLSVSFFENLPREINTIVSQTAEI